MWFCKKRCAREHLESGDATYVLRASRVLTTCTGKRARNGKNELVLVRHDYGCAGERWARFRVAIFVYHLVPSFVSSCRRVVVLTASLGLDGIHSRDSRDKREQGSNIANRRLNVFCMLSNSPE